MPTITLKLPSAKPNNPLTAELAFTVTGAIRSKKTSQQIIPVGKFRKIIPSAAYREWHKIATAQVPAIMPRLKRQGFQFPISSRVNCTAHFFMPNAIEPDAVGVYESIADWLQDNEFIVNDRQIVSWDGSRVHIDRNFPRVEVFLQPVEEVVPGLFESTKE